MAQPSRFASAASALAVAAMLTGCATSKQPAVVSSGFGGPVKDSEVGLATRALIALNSNDVANAVSLAERAVEKTPDDAGFRSLLGNAYFAAGRFASAEAAYKDSLSIYAKQPQTALKLALAEIAQGRGADAIAFLNASRDILDPANYGLAVALAGEPRDAIEILQNAARQPGADAKIRQNLALAYALSGSWDQARLVASQDVSADQVDGRIQQWMQFATPAHPFDQVAALTGVKPAASDPGQPVRLALHQGQTRQASVQPPQVVAQPQVAVTVPVAPPQPAPIAAPIQVAQALPAPQAETPPPPPPPADPARVAAAAPQAEPPAPAMIAAAAAAAPEAPAAFAAMAAPYIAPKPRPAAPVRRAPVKVRVAAVHRGHSSAVVQLGSYRSPEWVAAAWTKLQHRYPALKAYLPMRARFDSPQGTFWRLSIQGFDSDRDARVRCEALRRSGAACFVRGVAGDAPVEIASR